MYQHDARLTVRSAGTADQARRKLSLRDLQWSDLVFVMEHAHKKRIHQKFRDFPLQTPIFVLDIPDEFEFMDSRLMELIRDSVDPILETYFEN